MQGLKAHVIKKNGSNLNLISETHSEVFVIGPNVLDEGQVEENVDHLPVLVLSMRGGWRAEPVEAPVPGNFGWFPSGNFLEIEIGGQRTEVTIYDRHETPEQHNFYSR
jgi:hypothetical protein